MCSSRQNQGKPFCLPRPSYSTCASGLKQGIALYQCSRTHLRKRKKTNKGLNIRHYGNKIKILIELRSAGIYYKVETATEKNYQTLKCLFCGVIVRHVHSTWMEHTSHMRAQRSKDKKTKKNKQWSCFREEGYAVHISLHTTQPAPFEEQMRNMRQKQREGRKLYVATFLTKKKRQKQSL